MKKVEINELQFKDLLDGAKNSVSADRYRPVLGYIQIRVNKDNIVAYSTNGYRASRVEIKNNYEIDEEFVCYIKPFTFKPTKKGTNIVTLELTDAFTLVSFLSDFGVIKQEQPLPKEHFIDLEKIYNKARVHDRKVAFNCQFVISALKALKNIGEKVVFETKSNNKEAFLITAENSLIKNEQLILPIRIEDNI